MLGVWEERARGKGTRPGPHVHDDLVNREFAATGSNELWLSDISEHWTREDRLSICAVKDVFSNRIAGYAIDSRMKSSLAVGALNNGVMQRGSVTSCILRTDKGSQFRSRKFRRALDHYSVVGSMGRVVRQVTTP